MMVDKLVEEICEAIAPSIFCGFDGCTEAQAQWSWPGHTDKDRALIREIAADALAIAQKRVNELEAKAVSYDHAHEDAVEMGYPSLTEALEHLEELRK